MKFRRTISIALLLLSGLGAYAQEPGKDIQVNKQPFIDLQRVITDLRDKKHIGLETPFEVVATGTFDRKGKIDPLTLKYLRSESSSPEILSVVKQGIGAINESAFLEYLSALEVKEIQIEIKQDSQTFSFALGSEFLNETRVKSISSLISTFLAMKKQEIERKENTSSDADDLFLLRNAKSEASGKLWKFTLSFPKAEFWKMLERRFTEQKITQQNNDVILINKKPLPN